MTAEISQELSDELASSISQLVTSSVSHLTESVSTIVDSVFQKFTKTVVATDQCDTVVLSSVSEILAKPDNSSPASTTTTHSNTLQLSYSGCHCNFDVLLGNVSRAVQITIQLGCG